MILFYRYYSSFFLACGLPILKFTVHFTFTKVDYSLSQHISSVIMAAELLINYLTEITVLWWTTFLRMNSMKMELVQEVLKLRNCIQNVWFLSKLWKQYHLKRHICFLKLSWSWDICYIFIQQKKQSVNDEINKSGC